MEKEGWISIHRRIQDCWIWNEDVFSKGQAWIDLLLMANHRDVKIAFGNQLIMVEAGSFITSKRKLAERWKWSNTKVDNFLSLLESDKMIVVKSDTKKTLVTVENYGFYQSDEGRETTPKRNKNETKTKQKRTNNNDNNDNNENKREYKYSLSIPPVLEDVTNYCLERGNGIDAQAFLDFYDSKGWMVGKNKMKDWQAAIRTWEQKRGFKPKEVVKKTEPVESENEMTEEEWLAQFDKGDGE